MVREGLITQAEALRRVASIDLTKVEQTHLAATQAAPLASATGAGPGVASGAIALDAQAVARLGQGGQHVILLRPDTVTDDIAALVNAAGILTRAGSRTSHAAVVARQLGKVCLVGCRDLAIDMSARRCRIGTHDLAEGDLISLDGNEGRIYAGAIEVVHSRPNEALALVEAWRRDN
ncbi:MAG: PEP-utilizing enzyme [Rhodospirillales bacterium]